VVNTVPAVANIGNTSGTVGLKIQLSSDNTGAYVPVVVLDTESAISIGAVSQEGTWVINQGTGGSSAWKVDPSGVTSPVSLASLPALAAGSNEIGFVGPSGSNGVDYSTNTPSLSGLTLLATIAASSTRLGYFIQSQDTNGLTIALDDEAGSLTPTIVQLSGAASSNAQGGSLSMSGMPHSGRIRIYGASSGVQMAARAW
jgi:hypothetical protein